MIQFDELHLGRLAYAVIGYESGMSGTYYQIHETRILAKEWRQGGFTVAFAMMKGGQVGFAHNTDGEFLFETRDQALEYTIQNGMRLWT